MSNQYQSDLNFIFHRIKGNTFKGELSGVEECTVFGYPLNKKNARIFAEELLRAECNWNNINWRSLRYKLDKINNVDK